MNIEFTKKCHIPTVEYYEFLNTHMDTQICLPGGGVRGSEYK